MKSTHCGALVALATATLPFVGCNRVEQAKTAPPPTPPPTQSQTATAAYTTSRKETVFSAYCTPQADEEIGFLQKALDALDAALPNVPPEESSYLERESRATNKMYADAGADRAAPAAASRRQNHYMNRPLYRVWDARQALSRATASVTDIVDPKTANQMWKDHKTDERPDISLFGRESVNVMSRMVRAIDNVSSLQGSLRELVESQGYQRTEILSNSQIQVIVLNQGMLAFELEQAMRCQLAHVALDAN